MLRRFLVVGAVATAVQYLAVGAVAYSGRTAAAAGATGYFAGSVASYLLNRRYTFRARGSHRRALARFYSMVAGAWLLTVACMALLADVLGWNLWLAQGVATGLCLMLNYVCSRDWVFVEKGRCAD